MLLRYEENHNGTNLIKLKEKALLIVEMELISAHPPPNKTLYA